jgi:hypothetical protein
MDAESNSEIAELRDALRHTQGRVMALEAEVRVLAFCLHLARAVPIEFLVDQAVQAVQQLHSQHGDEFPEVVRNLIAFREYLQAIERDARPQSGAAESN